MSKIESLPESAGLLVIGYGNTLRRDDGVGPQVVEAIAALNLPGVHTLVCQQLTPEFAEPVSRARLVIFVDAAVDKPSAVQMRPMKPKETSQIMAHAADPGTMLALARDVFGRYPEAWWLTIPAVDLEFGEHLSPVAQAGFHEAFQQIQSLAKSLLSV